MISFVWSYHWSPTVGLVGVVVELTYVVTFLLSFVKLPVTERLLLIVTSVLATTTTLDVPLTPNVMLLFADAIATLLVPFVILLPAGKSVSCDPLPMK